MACCDDLLLAINALNSNLTGKFTDIGNRLGSIESRLESIEASIGESESNLSTQLQGHTTLLSVRHNETQSEVGGLLDDIIALGGSVAAILTLVRLLTDDPNGELAPLAEYIISSVRLNTSNTGQYIIEQLSGGDNSEILSAIAQIPTNDAERILNALSPIRETQLAHSDGIAEIIRRLALGIDLSEILSAIAQIPTNDAERILNALSPIRETQFSHSDGIAEIIRRLALGEDFSEILNAIDQIPTNDAERILNALTPIRETQFSHSDGIAEIIRRLALGEDFSEILNAIDQVDRRVEDKGNQILVALAALQLADILGAMLQNLLNLPGLLNSIRGDTGNILSTIADILTILEALKPDESLDFSEILNAIDQIPTNDAERILNALTPIRETQFSHSDGIAEIIRRLALGEDFSEILNAIDQIPTNDAERILNALTPIRETQFSHSDGIAEIIRRLALGEDFSEILNAIDQVDRRVEDKGNQILVALAALQLADILGAMLQNLLNLPGLLNSIRGDTGNILSTIADILTVLDSLRGGSANIDDIRDLFTEFDNLRWFPAQEVTDKVWDEFKHNLSVTVDLSVNCADGSNLQEYKNPGMKGIERMLQGIAAKLEIMELNTGKGEWPIVIQLPIPPATEENPEPEAPEPIEFCSMPKLVEFLTKQVGIFPIYYLDDNDQQRTITSSRDALFDLLDRKDKLGSCEFYRPLSLTAGTIELFSRQDFMMWAFEQIHYADVNHGSANQSNYIPSAQLNYLKDFRHVSGEVTRFRVPRTINTFIDPTDLGTFDYLNSKESAYGWVINQFGGADWLSDISSLPETRPTAITDSSRKAIVPRDYFQRSIKINDLTNYLNWSERQFEEILGGWSKTIVLEDSDLGTEGSQPVTFTFSNASEAIAEIASLALQLFVNTETLLDIGVKGLIEAGTAKTEAIRAGRSVEAIMEYLGFEVTESLLEVPLAFSIPDDNDTDPDKDNDLSKILRPSLTRINYWNNTEEVGFQDSLTKLLNAAGILRAVHYQQVPADQISDTMRDLITRAGDFLDQDGIKLPNQEEGDEKSDFDLFLEEVERGFTDKLGYTGDPTKPYGRDFNRRPLIRKIDKDPNQQD